MKKTDKLAATIIFCIYVLLAFLILGWKIFLGCYFFVHAYKILSAVCAIRYMEKEMSTK